MAWRSVKGWRLLQYSSIPCYEWATMIGKLRNRDLAKRLTEIKVQTLVTVGSDEVIPKVAETIHRDRRIKTCSLDDSSYLAMCEEQTKYLQEIRDFVLS